MYPIMAAKTAPVNCNALLEAIAPAREYLGDLSMREQTQKEVDKAVDELPEPCPAVIRMSYVEGKKIKEIAAALDISIWKTRRSLYHGLYLLRVQFKSALYEHPLQILYGELPNRVRY